MVGIDIVDVSRIESLIDRHGDRFLERVFTAEEIRYARGKRRSSESFAGRFAAKEAFMKALGRRVAWKEVEILSSGSGKPYIRRLGIRFDSVSISHERSYAVSVVTIEKQVEVKV